MVDPYPSIYPFSCSFETKNLQQKLPQMATHSFISKQIDSLNFRKYISLSLLDCFILSVFPETGKVVQMCNGAQRNVDLVDDEMLQVGRGNDVEQKKGHEGRASTYQLAAPLLLMGLSLNELG